MESKSRDIAKLLKQDQIVWDECAVNYEQSIVGGHPDIKAYEDFEEDFLDRILLYLARDCGEEILLSDIGCGSARLHLHYGLKTIDSDSLPGADAKQIEHLRLRHPRHQYDRHLARNLVKIDGLDFSSEMIQLANDKIEAAGMGKTIGKSLSLQQGSAFDLEPMEKKPLPVLVSVCNSIGVMQREIGAAELFKSMGRAVAKSGGIAIISAYRRRAVRTFGLNNYESTMNVSGQPVWMVPNKYTGESYELIPRYYKRAHDPSIKMHVDVLDLDGKTIEKNVELIRDHARTQYAIDTGHIRMHSDYVSNWYSFDQFDNWMRQFWKQGTCYHFEGLSIDCVRAEPVQLAILDAGNHLKGLFERWWK